MEENELTDLQKVRKEIAKSCPNMPDYKIVDMHADYGLDYSPPDANTLRLIMLLASAEQKILGMTIYHPDNI